LNDDHQFSHGQIRVIQIGLSVVLLIGLVAVAFAARSQRPESSLLAPAPPSALIRLGKGTIEQVAASPDGRTIAVRTTLGLFVYRSDDLEPLWVETQEDLLQVGFSPDGRILWGLNHEGLIGWGATSGYRRLFSDAIWRQMGGHPWLDGPHTWAIAWEYGLPQTLAAPAPCGYQNEQIPEPVTLMCIDLLDVSTGRLIEQLPTVIQLRSPQDPIPSPDQPVSLHLGFNPATGEFFMAVQERLWFWDPEQQLLTGVAQLPGALSMAPAFSPDGGHALLSIRPNLYLFNRTDLTFSALDPLPQTATSLLYTLDGGRIFVGTSAGRLYEIGPQSGRIIQRHDLGQPIARMVTGQDLDTILLELGEGILVRWRKSTGELEQAIEGFWAPASEIAWAPAGDRLAAVSRPSTLERDEPRLLSLWQLDGQRLGQKLFGERIIDIAWSFDGDVLAVATLSAGGRVQWLEAQNLDVLREYSFEGGGLCGLAWSSDGRTAVATAELSVFIFEADSSSPSMTLNARDLWLPPGAVCRGVVWSPDASLIALEVANGQALFWDGLDGRPVDRLNPDPLDNQSSTVFIGWDSNNNPLLAGYDQNPGERDLEFRVSGIAQPTAVWMVLPSGRFEFVLPDVPIDLAWAPDGSQLAVAYQDVVEVIVWDQDSGLSRRRLEGHRGNILGLEWNWQGDTLASYSLDGSVILWQVDP
jgi:WD40 repeat protein